MTVRARVRVKVRARARVKVRARARVRVTKGHVEALSTEKACRWLQSRRASAACSG